MSCSLCVFIRLNNVVADLAPEVGRKNGDVHDRFLHFLECRQGKLFRQEIKDRIKVLRTLSKSGQRGRDNPRMVKGEIAAVLDGKRRFAEFRLFFGQNGVEFCSFKAQIKMIISVLALLKPHVEPLGVRGVITADLLDRLFTDDRSKGV